MVVGTGGCAAVRGGAAGGWAGRRGFSERFSMRTFGAALTAVCLGAAGVGVGTCGGLAWIV